MLNNKGPNMDPWGTPNKICSQELKSEFILVLCLRWSVVLIKPLWVGFKKKQPFRYVLRKRCSENMQQIYRSKPKPKCDFNKVSLQLIFRTPFSRAPLDGFFWFIRVRRSDFSKVITQEQQATTKPEIYLCGVCMCLCVGLSFFNNIGVILKVSRFELNSKI